MMALSLALCARCSRRWVRRYRDGCIKHGGYPWEFWTVSDLWHIVDQNSNQVLPNVTVSTNIRRLLKFSECVENAKGEEGEPAAFDFAGEPSLPGWVELVLNHGQHHRAVSTEEECVCGCRWDYRAQIF